MNYAEAAALRRLAAHQARRSGSGRAARPRSTMLTPSELPRPPPKDLPNPVVYDKIARPRAYYQRPVTKKDLPIISVSDFTSDTLHVLIITQSRWPALAAFGLAGIAAWGAFILYATNQERLSSSVVRQILVNLRESEAVVDALGEGIRPEPAWYLNGDPWISGSVEVYSTTYFLLCG